MADNISSSVLFHFTNCIDHLKSILRDGFYPHYCLEYTLDPRDLKAATNGMPPARAIPMVCFCDLPLSLISKHLKEYGCFGIGLSKSWGTQNGLAPVIYTHSKACTRLPLSRLAVEAISLPDAPFTQEIRYMAAHSKPFHGPAWRKKSVHKDT